MQAPDFDYLVPDWPAPAHVRALFSCRNGGHSGGHYASLNLGVHVGDDPADVVRNRTRLQATLGVRAVFLDQVHGCDMVAVQADTVDAAVADGAYTAQSDVACTVMVADCLPVLFCDAHGHQVAAAHAGWRGLLGVQGQGVLEAAVARFSDTRNAPGAAHRPDALLAWLGPCIGPKAFEVGDDVRRAFVDATPEAAAYFLAAPQGKWMADLPALARQRLRAMGIARTYGNDGSQDWCTVSNPSRFFSHRRDGVSGRMAACIWRIG